MSKEIEAMRPSAEVAAELVNAQVRAELDRITRTYLALAEHALAAAIKLDDATPTPKRKMQ